MKRFLTVVLLATGLIAPALAQQSMQQVRYLLHQNPEANVIPQLTALAESGNVDAMVMLGSELTVTDQLPQQKQALQWFVRAFARGRGTLQALPEAAELADRSLFMRTSVESFLRRSQPRYDAFENPRSVTATLDQLLVFPDLVNSETFEKLIALHRRACVSDCRIDLLEGYRLQTQGKISEASERYEQAMRTDPRAVRYYVRMHGDNAEQQLQAFVSEHQSAESMNEFSTAAMLAVVDEMLRFLESYDPKVQTWIEETIRRGSVRGRIFKANYMISLPTVFTAEDTFAVIDSVELDDPTEAAFLRASALTMNRWLTFNPWEAHAIYTDLATQFPRRTRLAMAYFLMSTGLEQPNPKRAEAILINELEDNPSGQVYERLANLYAGTPGMCAEPAKARAYSRIAMALGRQFSAEFLNEIDEQLDDASRAEADTLYNQFLRQLDRL